MTLALWALALDPRPGLGAVLASPVLAKTVSPAGLAVLALALVWALIHPAAPRRRSGTALAAAGLGLTGWLALALGRNGIAGLAMALDRPDLRVCLVSVPVLSLAPLGGILWALQSGAPTRPALT